jgi:hypothetical protein
MARWGAQTVKPRIMLVATCLAALAGCSSMGPGTVARDRFEYSTSIGESWKRQTLLNIVKLRYLDPPIFVDVGQIVAGYSFESDGTVAGELIQGGGNNLTLAGHATYTDRPTITYTPLTGNKFIKALMTPLTPESVFFMIQSGWPADSVLLATVSSINGLKNQEQTLKGTSAPEPDFLKALTLMRRIQLSGAVAFRVQQEAGGKGGTDLLSLRRKDIAPETLADSMELRRLLRLDPEADEFKLVFGGAAANDKEVAVQTRSIIRLMQTMATQVDVSAADLAEHRASPGWESAAGTQEALRVIQIRSSKDRPTDAFVSVNYRNQWFWIDDRDLKSKGVFTFMLLLFTLADTGEQEPLPLITIPAQ